MEDSGEGRGQNWKIVEESALAAEQQQSRRNLSANSNLLLLTGGFDNSPPPVHFNSPPTVLNIAFLHAAHEAKYKCISQHYDSTVQEKQFLKCKYLCKYFAKYADCAGFERMVLLAQQHIPLHHRINGQGAYLDTYM